MVPSPARYFTPLKIPNITQSPCRCPGSRAVIFTLSRFACCWTRLASGLMSHLTLLHPPAAIGCLFDMIVGQLGNMDGLPPGISHKAPESTVLVNSRAADLYRCQSVSRTGCAWQERPIRSRRDDLTWAHFVTFGTSPGVNTLSGDWKYELAVDATSTKAPKSTVSDTCRVVRSGAAFAVQNPLWQSLFPSHFNNFKVDFR